MPCTIPPTFEHEEGFLYFLVVREDDYSNKKVLMLNGVRAFFRLFYKRGRDML